MDDLKTDLLLNLMSREVSSKLDSDFADVSHSFSDNVVHPSSARQKQCTEENLAFLGDDCFALRLGRVQ